MINEKKEDIVMYFAQESNVLAGIPNDNLEVGNEAGNMGYMLLQTPTGKYGENVKSNAKIMKEAGNDYGKAEKMQERDNAEKGVPNGTKRDVVDHRIENPPEKVIAPYT